MAAEPKLPQERRLERARESTLVCSVGSAVYMNTPAPFNHSECQARTARRPKDAPYQAFTFINLLSTFEKPPADAAQNVPYVSANVERKGA